MIYTEEMIWEKALEVKGTYIKRNNLRKKLKDESNKEVNSKILECKGKIRDLRAFGAKEEVLRHWYSEVTQLEMRIL